MLSADDLALQQYSFTSTSVSLSAGYAARQSIYITWDVCTTWDQLYHSSKLNHLSEISLPLLFSDMHSTYY